MNATPREWADRCRPRISQITQMNPLRSPFVSLVRFLWPPRSPRRSAPRDGRGCRRGHSTKSTEHWPFIHVIREIRDELAVLSAVLGFCSCRVAGLFTLRSPWRPRSARQSATALTAPARSATAQNMSIPPDFDDRSHTCLPWQPGERARHMQSEFSASCARSAGA